MHLGALTGRKKQVREVIDRRRGTRGLEQVCGDWWHGIQVLHWSRLLDLGTRGPRVSMKPM